MYNKNEESAPVDGRSQSSVKKITAKFGRLGGYFLLLSRKIIYKSEVNPTRKIPAWMKSVIEIDNEVGGNCEKIISGNFIFVFMYRM